MISRNYFTLAYVFGTYRKLGQTEIIFSVDRKICPFTRKTNLGFILPSNDFHHRKIEEREKQQEEIALEATLDHTTTPNPRLHWSCRTLAPARSRRLKHHWDRTPAPARLRRLKHHWDCTRSNPRSNHCPQP